MPKKIEFVAVDQKAGMTMAEVSRMLSDVGTQVHDGDSTPLKAVVGFGGQIKKIVVTVP